ncbi:MAG: HalOD1 output domain-containing protein [Haloferacaceae archaeon]
MNLDISDPRYDDTLGAYRVSHTPGGELSTTVALIVSDVIGGDEAALPPLRSVLDPDALDALFAADRSRLRVEFEYGGCLVSIRRGPEILVYPPGYGTRLVGS